MFRVLALGLAVCLATSTASADIYGLSEGSPDLQSAGALAFGPDGILFVGDVTGAAVFAIRTGDQPADATDLQIEGFNNRLAEELGVTPAEVQINDLAVNPATGNVFFSLGLGPENAREPAIVRLGADGSVSPLDLSEIAFSKVTLPDAPADEEVEVNGRRRNYRPDAITDLAFVDGQLLISGMTSKEGAPTGIRSVLFPFAEVANGTNLEIFHAAHGSIEDHASIRTFVPIIIDGEPNILAGFICTPLVRFPISEIGSEQIEGTTVAELGNRNRPFDLISYERDGENFLLMANNPRGVMKISTADIGREEGITEPIPNGGTGGQSYETIDSLAGTVQLDKLNDTQAVVLIDRGNGSIDLHTVPLP